MGFRVAVAAALLVAGCAGGTGNVQGRLQPQATQGPCTVKTFYLLAFTAVRTEMAVDASGQACAFVVLNPALQAFPTAVLVTEPARHGRAEAGQTNGGRSPIVSYTPQPGFAGADRFAVTIEPNAHTIVVAVQVGGAR